MHSLLLFLLTQLFTIEAGLPVKIGPGFWNVRSSFMIDGFDIGTQMSLIQLKNGKFLIIDTVAIDAPLKNAIDTLTGNGTLMEAVLASHPFHTTYFPSFYKLYPKVPYYGTPRHIRIQPQIPWKGSLWDCATRQQWLPEVHMRIARGSEFVQPEPEDTNHFSGIHIFHEVSKTIHIDDTIMYDEPFAGDMLFHPSLLGPGLYHIPESPHAFRDWVQKMIKEWDFDNICAAHNGVKIGGAKDELQTLLNYAEPVFDGLIVEYSLFPNATDAQAFKVMEAHETKCKE
jgi:hypothetical protein